MACWMCIYGRSKEKSDYCNSYDNWGPFENKPGFCTKNPAWVEVTAKHFCHELKMKDPYLPGQWRDQLTEDREVIGKKCEEIKKLKERNKYLNAKLKSTRDTVK